MTSKDKIEKCSGECEHCSYYKRDEVEPSYFYQEPSYCCSLFNSEGEMK